jgi:hypothetical protein
MENRTYLRSSVPRRARGGGADSPLQSQPGAGEDGIPEVPADGAQRILLHHGADLLQLLDGLGVVDAVDERDALHEGQVGPVLALRIVAVVGVQEVGEDLALVLGVVGGGVVGVRIARLGAVGGADDAVVGRVVVLVDLEAIAVLLFAAGHCGLNLSSGWRLGRGSKYKKTSRRKLEERRTRK